MTNVIIEHSIAETIFHWATAIITSTIAIALVLLLIICTISFIKNKLWEEWW